MKLKLLIISLLLASSIEVISQCEISSKRLYVYYDLNSKCELEAMIDSLIVFKKNYEENCFGQQLTVRVSPNCDWIKLEAFHDRLKLYLVRQNIPLYYVRFYFLDIETDFNLVDVESYVRLNWACICPHER